MTKSTVSHKKKMRVVYLRFVQFCKTLVLLSTDRNFIKNSEKRERSSVVSFLSMQSPHRAPSVEDLALLEGVHLEQPDETMSEIGR